MDLKTINEIKKKYPTAIIKGDSISYPKGTPDKKYLPKNLYEFEKEKQRLNGGGVLTESICGICFQSVDESLIKWDDDNNCDACPDCYTPSLNDYSN